MFSLLSGMISYRILWRKKKKRWRNRWMERKKSEYRETGRRIGKI